MRKLPILIGLVVLNFGSTAHSQEKEELIQAFSGDWYVFDSAMQAGDSVCGLKLNTDQIGQNLAAAVEGCNTPLAHVEGWAIREGQIVLADKEGDEVAILGGNQRRITGSIADEAKTGLVVERSSGNPQAANFSAAVSEYRCIFLGYTDKCASKGDLELSYGKNNPQLEILVNLNVRTQPRDDASVIGTIPSGALITVDQCLVASDGPWCSAKFGDRLGWFSRNTMRQGTWPIATFVQS